MTYPAENPFDEPVSRDDDMTSERVGEQGYPERDAAAVVAGNVETSQCITDALYGALGVMAASYGTMNNFTFGNARHQYYETISGGSGMFKGSELEVVVPPVSVLAEFPVAVVDRVVDQKGTRKEATEYLKFQYTPEIQRLLAGFNYRVTDPAVAKEFESKYAPVKLINPTDVLGSWTDIQSRHFAANGVLDQLLAK